jgi:hypothetical protein
MHQRVLRLGRRILVAVGGVLLIGAGIVLALPLVPGPGIALILLGLGLLSMEFERPRLLLARIKSRMNDLKQRFEARRSQAKDGQ